MTTGTTPRCLYESSAGRPAPPRAAWSERGEGIISTAIAVLIIAALGVVAYGAFNGLFTTANHKAETQIQQIGG